ncbi:MAG: hypothetical protein Q9M94_03940 [Candidatus Gracilibacteria bacterium]|nr:hypothetical protein [Candidatus Gracilibacteria bacterium]MDQ7023230.1 hypothetical protein [Candidatus Gracilibacteria bacterium]
MYNFVKMAILYSGPKTIKSFGNYRLNSSDNGNKENILIGVGKLFL